VYMLIILLVGLVIDMKHIVEETVSNFHRRVAANVGASVNDVLFDPVMCCRVRYLAVDSRKIACTTIAK
jgi:hypothetical protein